MIMQHSTMISIWNDCDGGRGSATSEGVFKTRRLPPPHTGVVRDQGDKNRMTRCVTCGSRDVVVVLQ